MKRIFASIPFLLLLSTGLAQEAAIRVSDELFDLNDSKSLGLNLIPEEHFEIHRATEESGFRFSHHPGLTVFKNQLYCSWSNGRAHEDRPDQRVLYASSVDGKTWSTPQILTEPPEGSNQSYIAAGFHVHDHRLIAYFTIRHDYPTHNLYHPKNAVYAQSSTDGVSWTEPKKVASGFFIEGPRHLSDGRVILAGEHAGEKWKSHLARMRLLYSDALDEVTDWKEATIDPTSAQPNGLKVFGYTEPCPYVLENGSIICPFRNQSGFLYASVSHDNGETWSVPLQTRFPDSMARFNTGRLPNGNFYLINNPGPGKMNRALLTIALSEDGNLFDRAWIIRGAPTTQRFEGKGKRDGWQYPTSVVWNDSLFVAYSKNKEDVFVSRIKLDVLK